MNWRKYRQTHKRAAWVCFGEKLEFLANRHEPLVSHLFGFSFYWFLVAVIKHLFTFHAFKCIFFGSIRSCDHPFQCRALYWLYSNTVIISKDLLESFPPSTGILTTFDVKKKRRRIRNHKIKSSKGFFLSYFVSYFCSTICRIKCVFVCTFWNAIESSDWTANTSNFIQIRVCLCAHMCMTESVKINKRFLFDFLIPSLISSVLFALMVVSNMTA